MERKRFWFGIGVTVVWLMAGAAYFTKNPDKFTALEPNALGDFAAGFFAPLAFFWLVLGYLQQGEELQQNTAALRQQAEELRRAAEQAEHQAKAIAANELHARRDTFLRVAELLKWELDLIVRDIVRRLGMDARESAKNMYEAGDKDAYFWMTKICLVNDRSSSLEKLNKGDFSWESVERYCAIFEKILNEASICDPDGFLKNAFEFSRAGEVYKIMKNNLETRGR